MPVLKIRTGIFLFDKNEHYSIFSDKENCLPFSMPSCEPYGS